MRVAAFGLLIVCIGFAVRAYDIGQQSLWSDELFSRYYADLFGLKFLWTTGLPREDSPPLYYMAIAGWMDLFGTSEAAMRSLSLVASLLTLPLVYLIGRELLDEHRGLLAALIFALSPMQVSFSQEARTYALLLLPICAALLAIAWFLRGDMRPRVLWLYGISAIVAIYCHATAAFFIAACNLAVIATIASDRRIARRAAVVRWIVANGLVALAALPEVAAMAHEGATGNGIQWIPPFRPVDVVRALSPVIVGTATPDRFPGAELSFLVLAGLVATLAVQRHGRRVWIVLVAIPALFIALIAIASLERSIFIARVFCWLGIPLSLLLADALTVRTRLRPSLVIVAAAACLTGLICQFTDPQKEPWREIFKEIGPQLARADHVILAPMTDPTPFAYYAPYLTHLELWDTGPRGNIENDELPDRMGVQRITRDRLTSYIEAGENVWLIMRTPDMPYVRSLLTNVPPPRLGTERSCGKVVCIEALSWPRSTSRGITADNDR
jgi:mannosyltransferase